MTSYQAALASKLAELTALLDDPHADDDDWAVDLLYTLEAIYEIALHPETPIVTSLRAQQVIAA